MARIPASAAAEKRANIGMLLQQGQMSQKEIAVALGCSLRMVSQEAKFLSNNGNGNEIVCGNRIVPEPVQPAKIVLDAHCVDCEWLENCEMKIVPGESDCVRFQDPVSTIRDASLDDPVDVVTIPAAVAKSLLKVRLPNGIRNVIKDVLKS